MSRRNAITATRRLTSLLFSNRSYRFPSKTPSFYSQFLLNHPSHLPQIPITMTPQLHHYTFIHHNSTAMSSLLTQQRLYSSSSSSNQSDPNSSNPNPNPNPNSEMKHQEIEGPTVERDLSPLASESREVTDSLLKTMYNLTRALAILGLAHLSLGTYTYAFTSMSGSSLTSPLMVQTCVISAIAFGFPFSMAFMLRQSLKPMHFFQKMEQIGRLQILTSTMQISKHLLLFFVRLRALSYLCVAALSSSFLYSLSSYL